MKKPQKRVGYEWIFKAGNLLFMGILLSGACYRLLGQPSREEGKKDRTWDGHPSYMVYYGELNDDLIAEAKQYDIAILHPRGGDITREQVQEIQDSGTCVLGYLSIGEDLRTAGMTPEEMKEDERFTGDKTGPRVDPRKEGDDGLDNVELSGSASPEGDGYASYYLDDNDHDGKPDFNPNFGCAYTNIGDPVWYDELNDMMMDGADGIPGIREILTDNYGRGLGCDGLFLDTIDTCAPNKFTKDDDDPARTRFEWTAPGVADFIERLKEEYGDKYVLQNRGLFFYNYNLPHFDYAPGKYIDFLLYESYMLDSSSDVLYHEGYFQENKNVYAPKLAAEANRPDGFKVLSLGYAEGPEEYELKESLLGNSEAGIDILIEDMEQAQDGAGFSHYITDGALLMANDFVLEHEEEQDLAPPVWSSVHNDSIYDAPKPRIGIGQAEPIENGMIVRWDVAVDKSGVAYTLYYQKEPFDFKEDADLEKAQKIELIPDIGKGYGYDAGEDTYPYEAVVRNLDAGETYYFVIRAKDCSPAGNEEKNTEALSGVPMEGQQKGKADQ